ncbi:MAG: hypothetical protein PUB37_08145 [Firmicutes bacterium]|nr:hypothetical protein [Bacillota bacterium]
MAAHAVFSVIIFICALVSYAAFRLWQGRFAGKNYMRNEYGIEEDDTDNERDGKDNKM